jgi:signal transduction histidine kinase
VAHDLKAPLRHIDGYSRILLEHHSHGLDADGKRLLQVVRASTERMNQLINGLLAYSRLEQRTLAVGSIAVQPFVDALVAERRADLTESGIALALDLQCDLIVGDREALGHALRNYIDNAIKFTRGRPSPRIELGVARDGSNVRLWVRDNGIGFDMKYHDKIFEIFQRLHAEDEHPGTGIGLALVRKAMERHRGRAWAESAPGQGSTFWLEIPDATAAPLAA